jgi:hypothetical protein
MSGLQASSVATLAAMVSIVPILVAMDRGAPREDPSADMLQLLVDSYAHAIEVNNRELALTYVHPRSPSRREIDAALREQLSWYLERVRTSEFERTRRADGMISARVDQEFVRVFGLKITRGTRRSIYYFRAFGEAWRIWEIDEVFDQT